MKPALPDELWDEIFDNLEGDTGTLRASSLTCHDWQRRAQRSLFRTVYVVNAGGGLKPYGEFSALTEAVQSSPALATYIQRLEVWQGPHPPHAWMGKFSLQELFAMCVNLRYLVLDYFHPEAFRALMAVSPIPPFLEDLEIVSMEGAVITDISSVLLLAPKIHRLTLRDVCFWESAILWPLGHSLHHRRVLSIHTLCLVDVWLERDRIHDGSAKLGRSIGWLFPMVHTVVLDGFEDTLDYPLAGGITSCLGERLQYLIIDTRGYFPSSAAIPSETSVNSTLQAIS